MALILHIDTSADTGLTALAKDGVVVDSIINTESRNHAATLNTNIEGLVSRQSITLNDIDAFCVCGGPGSYTGLRIGLATAKGFCYAMDKPLMMHSRLLLIALAHIYDNKSGYTCFTTLLEAREDEYFSATFNQELNNINNPSHVYLTDLEEKINNDTENTLYIGQITDSVKKLLTQANKPLYDGTAVDISSWSRYAHEQYLSNAFVNLVSAEPFYLKQAFTHKPKKTK